MAKFHVQMEVALMISVEVEARTPEEALAEGRKFARVDLVAAPKKGSLEDWNVYTRGVFADASIMNVE